MQPLSEILVEMADRVLTLPAIEASDKAAWLAVLLSTVAWDQALDPKRRVIVPKEFWASCESDPNVLGQMKCSDFQQVIRDLQEWKKEHHAEDRRYILDVKETPEATLRVHWIDVAYLPKPRKQSVRRRLK